MTTGQPLTGLIAVTVRRWPPAISLRVTLSATRSLSASAWLVRPPRSAPRTRDVDEDGHVAALEGQPGLPGQAAVEDGLDDLDGAAAGGLGRGRDVGLAGAGGRDGDGAVEQASQEGIQVLGREQVGGAMVGRLDARDDDAGPVEHVALDARGIEVGAGVADREGGGSGRLGQGNGLLGVEEAVSIREGVGVRGEHFCRREQLPEALRVEASLHGERRDGMQPPDLDRLAEDHIAEVSDQGAQRIVGLVLPAELENLVDAAEDGLRALGGGARVGVRRLQVFEEDLDPGLAGGDDVEASGAGLTPFLVGEGFQVRHAAERGDGTEQLAGRDRDVERREGAASLRRRPKYIPSTVTGANFRAEGESRAPKCDSSWG
jgi:hypothetical protein